MFIDIVAALEKKQMSCPPDCGPFGTCLPCKETDNCSGERCQCDHSHAGEDCSLEIEFCPAPVNEEGTAETCFNGGRCVDKVIYDDFGYGTMVWRCDCRYATGDAAAFAGAQCEFPSTRSCLVGGAESDSAFCVNGGDCVREIIRGQPHPGCTNCPGFEGRHCQYEAGKAPPEELQSERKDVIRGSDDVKPGFIILIVLLGCLVLGGLTIFVCMRTNKSDGKSRDVNLTVPDDLKLNESMDNDKGNEPPAHGGGGNNDDDDDDEHGDDALPKVV